MNVQGMGMVAMVVWSSNLQKRSKKWNYLTTDWTSRKIFFFFSMESFHSGSKSAGDMLLIHPDEKFESR